jgi:hypothetical protein
MVDPCIQEYRARWSDMDWNQHVLLRAEDLAALGPGERGAP